MGNITENIDQAINTAVKNKNQIKVSTLRMLKTALVNMRIEKGGELDNEEEVLVVAKEVKKREEAATAFKSADRVSQAEAEMAEAEILKEYLPPQLSDEELGQKVAQILTDQNLSGLDNFGRAMGAVKKELGSSASGERISQAVREALN